MKKKGIKKSSQQRKRSTVGKKISQAVTWTGIVLIGILAIPTGALIALISGIWSLTDKIAAWIDDEKHKKT